ncbi:subunit Rpb1 of DNA-directed RNA polymerase, partial [Hamiltosporidium magnivora]
GVSYKSSKQEGDNDKDSNIKGVSYKSSKQEGDNDKSNNLHPVNNTNNTHHPVNNTNTTHHPVNTNHNNNPELLARCVKGRLERVCLKDVCTYIKEIYGKYEISIEIGVNLNTIKLLCLDIDMVSIKNRICEELKVGKEYVYIKGGVIVMSIRRGISRRYNSVKVGGGVNDSSGNYGGVNYSTNKQQGVNYTTNKQQGLSNSTTNYHPVSSTPYKQHPLTNTPYNNNISDYYFMKDIKRSVRNVVICGLKSVQRVVLHKGENINYTLLVEGNGLLGVLGSIGVDSTKTSSNNIMEIQSVLGIEGARQSIINEVEYTMSKHGMKIDCRHVMLLADTMTYRGEVLGITRFGISKMKCSTLMLASFEQTGDHLFEAALYGNVDSVLGVSESIIMGRGISIGTGATELYYEDRGSDREGMGLV